ncbi:MAG: class I SAM-dependent methyltransferase [Streptosporangiaceae bacterium]
MPDAIFAYPRLAAVYDTFDGHRDDLNSYLALAEELAADTVLDIGCGTGSLAVLLAAGGRTVVAVDPAEASLTIAKAKYGAAKVRWIHGDATGLPPLNADLAVMTGNVAQVFLTDDEWESSLAAHGYRVVDVRDAPDRPGREFVFIARRT